MSLPAPVLPSPALPSPTLPSPATGSARRIAPIRRSNATTSPQMNANTSPVLPTATPILPVPAVLPVPNTTPVAASPVRRISPIRRSSPTTDATSPVPVASATGVSPTRISPTRISPTRVSPTNTSPTRISPSRISPTNASPTRISPTRISPTRISPTRVSPIVASPVVASPTRISPTRISPSRISPTRRSMERREVRNFYRTNPRLVRDAYRGALITDAILTAAAAAAAVEVAQAGAIEPFAVKYAEHYAKDVFWRRVFAIRFPQIFASVYGDLPMCPVKGLDSKEGRPVKSWREYFQLVSGNLMQDEAVVVDSGKHHSYMNEVLWKYQVPGAGEQDALVLHTYFEGGKHIHVLTYYYTSDSEIKSIRELFRVMKEGVMARGGVLELVD